MKIVSGYSKLCTHFNFVLINTFFADSFNPKVIRMHPHSEHCHESDRIIVTTGKGNQNIYLNTVVGLTMGSVT